MFYQSQTDQYISIITVQSKEEEVSFCQFFLQIYCHILIKYGGVHLQTLFSSQFRESTGFLAIMYNMSQLLRNLESFQGDIPSLPAYHLTFLNMHKEMLDVVARPHTT